MPEYRFTHTPVVVNTAVTTNPAHTLVDNTARKRVLPSYGDAWLDEMYQMGYSRVGATALEAHVGCRPGGLDGWGRLSPQNKAAHDAYLAGRLARDADDTADVEESLRMAAVGYTIAEDKVGPGGSVATVNKHITPDTGAGLKWLERRDAGRWADKQRAGNAVMQVERLTVVNNYLANTESEYQSPLLDANRAITTESQP